MSRLCCLILSTTSRTAAIRADGVGRATIECYVRHRTTRHVLVGSYRQLVTYRGDKVERLEEFHDAAKMIAFWQMVYGETEIERTLLAQPLSR